jgi:hypothetical protein
MPTKNVLLQVGERTIGPIAIVLEFMNGPATLEEYRDEAITCALEDGDLSPDDLRLVRATITDG